MKNSGASCARPTVPVIGLDPGELYWVKALIALLRHPDPAIPELTRHAIDYLTDSAAARVMPEIPTLDNVG